MTSEEKRKAFLDKWTMDYKPPKDNEAEKNQRGSMNDFQTIQHGIAASRNYKKKRKNKHKNIRRIIEEI